ncbi:MAG: thiamine-phosphate kinase [Pyrinomonadaceae bacterium]|nr:thiamine-phosphate kinase [Blastocatellia bacterium]MDQ3490492.1 thiamine-phosphate kinase [Acidobacteriota bacterium]
MRSEFDFINNLKSKYSLGLIGDDCAVLPKNGKTDLVVTADLLVEDIDFRLDWTTPEFLGHKALAVSLSDIAAMGASPVWAMLSIGVPENVWKTDFIDRFYEGWFTLAKEFDVELVGGDVSRTPEKIVIDSIGGGEVAKGKAILRSGAKPGDSIFVTGKLGGAAGGLMLLETGFRYADSSECRRQMIAKQLRPVPQITSGKYLLNNGIATAMIDLSDGLSSDLHHLCRASGVGARINVQDIPILPALSDINVAKDQMLAMAIHGGEDFELLFTANEKNLSVPNLPAVQRIGEITENVGTIEIVNGKEISSLPSRGYRHF